MLVHVSGELKVELQSAEDLKSFKLVAPKARAGELGMALERVGTVDGDHAWVLENWIRSTSSLRDDANWQAGVTKMIDYARKSGWVDAATGAIRAHIEWVG